MVNENQLAIEKDGDDISYLSSMTTRHEDSITKVTKRVDSSEHAINENKEAIEEVEDTG